MKDKFFAAISDYRMLSPGDTVLAAVSGGADSMCLVNLLYIYKEELGIKLTVAHVNHCLRGSESDADEAFVRAYCEKRDIPFYCLRADIAKMCVEQKISTELCARNVRYDYFSSFGFDKIATAHTASDAVETMHMNISRGSGLSGLCSIPPIRNNIIRPLCRFTRRDTERYCTEKQIGYVTDSSNLSDDYTRNKFRHRVLTALRDINPSYEENALRCIDVLREEDSFITACAAETYYKGICPDNSFRLSVFENVHTAVINRVIAKFISENSHSDYERKHILLLADNLKSRSFAVELPGGYRLCIKNGLMFFTMKEPAGEEIAEVHFDKNEEFIYSDGKKRYKFFLCAPRKLKSDEIAVDFSKIDDIITIRSRKEGDRLSLSGRGCTKTLKKLFSELKIPVSERKRIPVLADADGVIWCEAGGLDVRRKISADTQKYLIIKSECDKND